MNMLNERYLISYSGTNTIQCESCLKYTLDNPNLIKDRICSNCNKELWDKKNGY